MNKKSIEDKFSIDMDAYFKGIQQSDISKSEEYNELLKLGKALGDKDFSKSSNKQFVLDKALKNINEHKEDNIIKKPHKNKGILTAVALFAVICTLSISLTQTSFARDMAEKVIKTIASGHITAIQTERPKTDTFIVPAELKGKIFDEKGNPIEVLTKENYGNIYTAKGEKIASFSQGKIITEAEQGKAEKARKEKTLIVKEINDLNKYTCFKISIPSYLPSGYKFDRAELLKDKKGIVNNKYIDLFFTNEKTGKYIFIQQRIASEETKYVTGTDGKIEKIKINGVDAALSDNRYIDWEYNKVLYSLSGRGEITKTELVKIAESIK